MKLHFFFCHIIFECFVSVLFYHFSMVASVFNFNALNIFDTHCFFFSKKNKMPYIHFQCGPNWLSLVCTTVFLIYHLSWLIYDIYTQISDGSTDDELYFTKLPNWSYTMLIVTSNLVDFISTLLVHCKRQDIVLDKGNSLCITVICLFVLGTYFRPTGQIGWYTLM